MRRGLCVRPVTRRDPETAHPVDVQTAPRAVDREVLKLAFEVGLHLEQLEPQHLRVDRDRMIASTGSLRFIDEIVGLRRLLAHGMDGSFEDVAVTLNHGSIVVRGSVAAVV